MLAHESFRVLVITRHTKGFVRQRGASIPVLLIKSDLFIKYKVYVDFFL